MATVTPSSLTVVPKSFAAMPSSEPERSPPPPHHVCEREVDDGDPDTREQEPGAELDPLGQGTTDEGGGDDRECHLERDVDDVGGVAPGAGDEVAVSIGDAVLEAEELERVGKNAPDVLGAVGHRPSPQNVDDADDGHGPPEGHHHHVQDGLGPRHPAVEESEAGCHQQDQRCSHQHPCGVTGVRQQIVGTHLLPPSRTCRAARR